MTSPGRAETPTSVGTSFPHSIGAKFASAGLMTLQSVHSAISYLITCSALLIEGKEKQRKERRGERGRPIMISFVSALIGTGSETWLPSFRYRCRCRYRRMFTLLGGSEILLGRLRCAAAHGQLGVGHMVPSPLVSHAGTQRRVRRHACMLIVRSRWFRPIRQSTTQPRAVDLQKHLLDSGRSTERPLSTR